MASSSADSVKDTSMIRTILVPATGRPTDQDAFRTALRAAALGARHITFLHVRLDVADMVVAMSSGGLGGGGVQDLVDRMDEDTKALETKVHANVAAFCKENGITLKDDGQDTQGAGLTGRIVVETGPEAGWIAEHGRFADLVVVGRDNSGLSEGMLEAALMETGRPLLVPPEMAPASLAGPVMIAWKDTIESARAVAFAEPFIAAAEKVMIVSVTEGADPDPTAAQLQRSLYWHNPHTELRYLPLAGRAAVDVLMDEARVEGAGLVVMGGYSHSRLRQIVLGGFTRSVLRNAPVPVLMAH
jgi:nucleotide-binding universal stress UspA family protein